MNQHNETTYDEARSAVIRLLEIVRADSGVSPWCARLLLSTHGGKGNVDFSGFGRLDRKNLRAVETLMRYSFFERRLKFPLSMTEVEETRKYLGEQSEEA